MEYIGAVEGQPKAEPIDAPYNYNTDHLNEDPSISKNERVIPVESKIISLHDFLKQLTQFICILESLELEELKQQIKESISTDDDEVDSTNRKKNLKRYLFRACKSSIFVQYSRHSASGSVEKPE